MKTTLHRREVAEVLLSERKDLLVVAGLGSTAWDITAAGDSPLSFPLWGAMGNAAMIGLGLALAQPKRRVLVITGDGERRNHQRDYQFLLEHLQFSWSIDAVRI